MMSNNISGLIFILICSLGIELSIAEVELPKLKGIVKTIYGKYDVVDCVDIYQQPAFDHPLLKDHKIQISPQNIKVHQHNAYEESVFYETWHEMDECPKETVPIKRFEEVDEELLMKMKGGSIHSNVSKAVSNKVLREYSTTRVDEGIYYGTKFAATVWNPHVEPNELSLAQTWISAGPKNAPNTIEVGWTVCLALYNDYQTRLFIFWTTDGYKTGCYNQRCPGFVQLSRTYFPGMALSPISQSESEIYQISFAVYKAQGNWYLQANGETVGYRPANIFPLQGGSADRLAWGGEIINARNNGHHTTTQMGSGHYANEGYSRAATIFNVQVNTRENNPDFQRPKLVYPLLVSNGNCYSLARAQYTTNYGDHFFFGGPGYSSNCP